MASLSHGPRLNARTTPRIHRGIKMSAILVTSNGLNFQGRAVTSEAIISAILSEFLKLPNEDQKEFLKGTLKELEQELETIAFQDIKKQV